MHFTIPLRHLPHLLGSLAHFIGIISSATAQQLTNQVVDKTIHFLLFETSTVWKVTSKGTAPNVSGKTSIYQRLALCSLTLAPA
jgi:hypothetical protein